VRPPSTQQPRHAAPGDGDDTAATPAPRVPVAGGLVRRPAPVAGLRPTVRFALAAALTLAWVAFAVVVSGPWRDELDRVLGPVLAWVIPILLAYVPGLVIGFMAFTLILTPYRELEPFRHLATGPQSRPGVEPLADGRGGAVRCQRTRYLSQT
jgi:hypothetical protein